MLQISKVAHLAGLRGWQIAALPKARIHLLIVKRRPVLPVAHNGVATRAARAQHHLELRWRLRRLLPHAWLLAERPHRPAALWLQHTERPLLPRRSELESLPLWLRLGPGQLQLY